MPVNLSSVTHGYSEPENILHSSHLCTRQSLGWEQRGRFAVLHPEPKFQLQQATHIVTQLVQNEGTSSSVPICRRG